MRLSRLGIQCKTRTDKRLQFPACTSSGGNDYPHNRLPQVHTSPETDSAKKCIKDFDKNQENAADICHVPAFEEDLFQSPQGQE